MRNITDLGRTFLRLNYVNLNKNTNVGDNGKRKMPSSCSPMYCSH